MQPFLQWKSNEYYILWVCVCSLRYLACNMHVLYCHLWPVRLYNIFPQYVKKARFSRKKTIEHKICILIFPTSLSETFFILRRIERDNAHCTEGFMLSARYSCQILTNLEFSRQIFSKNSRTSNVMKIYPVGAGCSMLTEGRTDGQADRQTR